MKEFPCTQCGACCRAAGRAGLMPSKPDGSCVHLGDDNRCTIYEDRPYFCRIENLVFTEDRRGRVYREQAFACNQLQEEEEMDPRFRVLVD